MKPYYIFIVLLALLGGCEKESGAPSTAVTQANIIQLNDSSSIKLQGNHIKSHKKNNEKGYLVMHEFSYPTVDKVAENDLYGALKKNGYNRKVVANDVTKFKVHYYKKSSPTIGAIFTTQTEDTQYKTIASIYWQE
ncbi:hypothetical protein D3C79_887760 [compost metagenome]